MFSKKSNLLMVAIASLVVSSFACKALADTPQTPSEPAQGGNASVCSALDSIPTAGQYSEAPDMLINTNGNYTAALTLAKGGEIVIELYASQAPLTVNNFVFLACKGFYNNTTFHRVLQDFMAQGGDPTGTGMGGPGYEFVNEYSNLSFDKPGVVAMANAGPDTNGSQFFITFGPTEWLNGGYTIFGQVVEGMDVVMSITLRDPDTNPSFTGDVLQSVTISGQ
ncbi:MAG: peptidylprolyl isomerase [Anaerolineales bacterium]